MSVTKAVKFNVVSISGDSRAAEFGEPDSVLFANHLEIDGDPVLTEGDVRLVLDGSEGFLQLELHEPSSEQHERWKQMHAEFPEYWRELQGPHVMRGGAAVHLRETLTLDEVAEMNDEVVVLLVRSIEFEEPEELKSDLRDTKIRVALREKARLSDEHEPAH